MRKINAEGDSQYYMSYYYFGDYFCDGSFKLYHTSSANNKDYGENSCFKISFVHKKQKVLKIITLENGGKKPLIEEESYILHYAVFSDGRIEMLNS